MAMSASLSPSWQRKSWLRAIFAAVTPAVILAGCNHAERAPPFEQQAQNFVTLGLELGRLFPVEVDSYFGPAALQPSATAPRPSLATLQTDIARLQREIAAPHPDPRRSRLEERTRRLGALVELVKSKGPLSFDEESQNLYGIDSATPDGRQFSQARKALEKLLRGGGSLTERVKTFRERFIVSEKLRPAVFSRALAECRARTLRHLKLPPSERLDVEWTSEVGAAWHRYHGDFRSTLQVNPQAVAFLGSMIDVACHEGYPGHHVQFLLTEARFGAGRLPIEDRIVLLRSPGSVIREGAADYGVSLVFPQADRLAFERDVLFPMSGFPGAEVARFEQIRSLLDQLAPAALPILRAYRDHAITADAAALALDRDALIASPQALLAFVDSLGAYVVGYTGVREQIRGIVDAGSAPAEKDARWARLECLLRLADQKPLGRIAASFKRERGIATSCTDEDIGDRP